MSFDYQPLTYTECKYQIPSDQINDLNTKIIGLQK